MIDVAGIADLSIKTVSRVMNAEPHVAEVTRRRVLEVVQTLGYRPNAVARSLVTNRTQTVGLIVPDVSDPFWPEVVRGVEVRATQLGYSLLLCNTDEAREQETKYMALLAEKRVDGMILCSSRAEQTELELLVGNHSNTVLVNRVVESPAVSTVSVNNYAGGYIAGRHFLEHGYRRIAILAGPPTMYSTHDRVAGICAILTKSDIIPLSVTHVTESKHGWARVSSAREAATGILESPDRPEAIFAHDDIVAVGILECARRLSIRVPDELAVVGFDDVAVASLTVPPLTTVAIPKSELGAKAMDVLFDVMREGRASKILLEPHIVVRGSCGC